MGEWSEYRFSELLENESISYGIVQPGSHTETDSVPIVRVNNIKSGNIYCDNVMKVASSIEKNYSRTRLVGGELLITVVGSIGECAIVPQSLAGWNVARAVSVARIKDKYDKQFVRYAFKTDDIIFQMYGNTNDTVQPTLNLSLLKELKFLLPPLPEQKAIAAVLSSLDDKIDLLHRQNKTLEAMAETLFRQWFVEEADEGWEEGVLGDLVSVKYGKDHKKLTDGLIPVYGSGGIMRYADTSLYAAESVLIPRKGTLNNIIYIDEPFWTVDTMFYTEMKKPNIAKFIYHFVKDIDFAGMNVGSAVPSMTTEVLNNLPINIPPYSLIQEFNNVVNDLYKKKEANTIQIRTLEKLRDTLLPKLMSGEVRVDYKKEAAGEY